MNHSDSGSDCKIATLSAKTLISTTYTENQCKLRVPIFSLIVLVVFWALPISASATGLLVEQYPNIILVFIDDMGWAPSKDRQRPFEQPVCTDGSLDRYLLAQWGRITVIRDSGHASFDTSPPNAAQKQGPPASSLLLAEIKFPIIRVVYR